MRHTGWLLLAAILLPGVASAQDRRPSHCIAIADASPEIVWKAAWNDPIPDEYTVRLHYVGHSMYLLRTHGGIDVVTDYNGGLGTFVPDVVTMNNAHGSHWTPYPDPAIGTVLQGWPTDGTPADHHLDMDEMLIRNVTTDIRGPWDGARVEDGNSIFVFEVAGLCIGHLGHLHHEPSDETYAALGRLDVVMAAVDGGMTVDIPTMVRILDRLRSSVVLPMHWFSQGSLERFLAAMPESFDTLRVDGSDFEVSLRTMPSRPTIVVLQPGSLVE